MEITRKHGSVAIIDCYGHMKGFLASEIIGGRITGGQVQLFVKGMPEELQIDVSYDGSEGYNREHATRALDRILELADDINKGR